jgi:hypothetical protein
LLYSSFGVPVTRVKLGNDLLSKCVDGISCQVVNDLCASRRDKKKAQEIIHCCEIGSVNSFPETVLPGVGPVSSQELWLDRVVLRLHEVLPSFVCQYLSCSRSRDSDAMQDMTI